VLGVYNLTPIRIGTLWMPIRIGQNGANPTRSGSTTLAYAIPYIMFFLGPNTNKTIHSCTQDQVVFSTAILGAVAHGLYALSLLPQGEETRSQYQASGCGIAQFTAR
jgi:hypothetical protein